MAEWIDRFGAVAGDTVYCDGALVARDVSITLPELAFVTAEVNAGGPIDLPITGQTEALEATVTKVGFDKNIGKLLEPKHHTVEIRVAQDQLTAEHEKRTIQAKFFLSCTPKTIPVGSVEFGSPTENEISLAVFRVQQFVDNVEILCIDKPNGIFRVNGKDYGNDVESLL